MSAVKFGKIEFEGLAGFAAAVAILIIIAYVIYKINVELAPSAQSFADVLTSDSTKLLILTGVILLFMYVAISHAKVDDPMTLLVIGLIAGMFAFVALYYNDVKNVLKNVNLDLDILPEKVDEQKIREAIYRQYADPGNDEVYFVGAKTLNTIADNAGFNRCIHEVPFVGCVHYEDYVGIVFTDQIVEISETNPDPKTVWNRIIVGNAYPLRVYVDNKLYVVWCRIKWKKTDITLIPYVVMFSGKIYNVNNDYAHMPKKDAEFIMSKL